jgi:hypothetical protein
MSDRDTQVQKPLLPWNDLCDQVLLGARALPSWGPRLSPFAEPWANLEEDLQQDLWAFALRSVLLRCGPACGLGLDEAVRILSAEDVRRLVGEVARDAHATLRDEALWHRKRRHTTELESWSKSCDSRPQVLCRLLLDALIFAEWLDDVGFFAPGSPDECRQKWLRESPLVDPLVLDLMADD